MAEHPTPKRKPKKPSPTALSFTVGRLVELASYGTLGRNGSVSLGQLPGYPQATNDPEVVEKAAQAIRARIPDASPVKRLELAQRAIDLRVAADELRANADGTGDLDVFLAYGAEWAESKGITYAAFRELGFSPALLRDAGIKP